MVVKIHCYGGKNQFQEEYALLQATPNSLKLPLIGPSVMAGLHLSKLIKFHKSRSAVATWVNLFELIKAREKNSTGRNKRIFTVVKINFHGTKNQFSSPVTPTNFRAGYACTANTLVWLAFAVKTCNALIWLAYIRGKTCHTLIWLAGIRGKTCWMATEQVLPRMPTNQMRVLPVHA